MIFKVKEKFWSWGDEFTIFDMDDNPKYLVKGKAFSWGDKLSFQTIEGEELAFINQKLLSFRPKYEILIGGTPFAELKQEFSWFSKKFTLDVPGPNDYTIDGSFWQHEYKFTRRNKQVAEISKELWGWSDTYGVRINDNENEVAILCSCIVIDQILEKEERASSSSIS
ncbi:MAG: LURP-one-related family protein [Gammaproteobacteria bacterium]|nr:LURP-one-related family protein [Gammaproteobacteria bacterium]